MRWSKEQTLLSHVRRRRHSGVDAVVAVVEWFHSKLSHFYTPGAERSDQLTQPTRGSFRFLFIEGHAGPVYETSPLSWNPVFESQNPDLYRLESSLKFRGGGASICNHPAT